MDKKIFLIKILILCVLLNLAFISPVLANGGGEEVERGGFQLALELITLIIVGGIIYNLWISMGGFGSDKIYQSSKKY